MKKIKGEATVLLISVIAGLATASFMGHAMEWSCDNTWRDTGVTYRYDLSGGCQIKTEEGRWIPSKAYRAR